MEEARRFAADQANIAEARDFVTALGADDDVVLLTSELATNAIRHGQGDFVVTFCTSGATTRISVTNTGPTATVPRPRNPIDTEEGGRGLLLVSLLASDWGYRAIQGGIEVWFEMVASCSATS